MFSKFILRKIGIFTLIAFVFLVGTSEYSFASEEDVLLKARKYYQQGNYDESVKVLQKFIENLRAIVEQKRNVAEAFYLLAKVYYTVGEDAEVDKNLRKVFETFPTFTKEENDIEFKKRIIKIRKEMGLKEIVPKPEKKVEEKKPEKKIIQKEGKKKKKFPILLVVGGVVIVALIALLLLKKKDKKEDVFDIRGEWVIHEEVPADGNIFDENIVDDVVFTFSGQMDRGTFRDSYGDRGVYTVSDKSVNIRYVDLGFDLILEGRFVNPNNMEGDIIVRVASYTARGNWHGRRDNVNQQTKKSSIRKHSLLVEKLLSTR